MASPSINTPSAAPAEVADTSTKAAPSPKDERQARPRPARPNYRLIHRFPLPLSVHPLPLLIPHNPLSIVSVVLSYLTYFISPPHQEVYAGYFDSATSSVHVTDEKAIQALWEMGFFGKGTLSRSQPSWLEREKKRRGLLGGQTSEEATRQRRSERRELKLERARMEKILIEQRLKAEAAAKENGTPVDHAQLPSPANGIADGPTNTTEKFSLKKAREAKLLEQRLAKGDSNTPNDSPGTQSPNGSKTVRFSPVVQEKEFVSDSTVLRLPDPAVDTHETEEEKPSLKNEEHLQLSNEEAFFLSYGLGVLQVFDDARNTIIPSTSLLPLFCQHSYFPSQDFSLELKPDDPFMISYVVYHHFRSLGWVVRSGVKFGVDYLLYNRGPVFSHAEFAVVVIPAYEHPYWSETEDRKTYCASKQARSWWWLHCVNRVQAQVKKSLVVCYVEVPPPASYELETNSADIGALLSQYKVREMLIRRWVPNRTRD